MGPGQEWQLLVFRISPRNVLWIKGNNRYKSPLHSQIHCKNVRDLGIRNQKLNFSWQAWFSYRSRNVSSAQRAPSDLCKGVAAGRVYLRINKPSTINKVSPEPFKLPQNTSQGPFLTPLPSHWPGRVLRAPTLVLGVL